MKKLLLIALLIVGCEKYAPTDHTHEHEGVCAKYSQNYPYYTCYSSMNQKTCLREELDDLHAWYEDMTCEEFCALEDDLSSCEIIP